MRDLSFLVGFQLFHHLILSCISFDLGAQLNLMCLPEVSVRWMDVLGTFLVFFSRKMYFPLRKWGFSNVMLVLWGGYPFISQSNRGFSTGSLELHHAALHIPASNAPRCALSWGTNLTRDPLEVRHRWLLQELTCWMGEILRFFFCVLHEVEYLFTYLYILWKYYNFMYVNI